MAKVYNPTIDCVVKHNVNSHIYEIPPKKSVEVREHDVEELLTILGFLVVLEEGGAGKQRVLNSETHQPEWKEVDVEIVKEKAKKDEERKLKCKETIVKKDVGTGLKKKVKCGYETTSKRALLAHVKGDHPKPRKRKKDEDED